MAPKIPMLELPCLTRAFIQDRLYHPSLGYFNQSSPPIGKLVLGVNKEAPLNFKSMLGFEDYQRELSAKYPPGAWLTPSEVFRPWYGMSIANYVKQVKLMSPGRLRIVEVGAGSSPLSFNLQGPPAPQTPC